MRTSLFTPVRNEREGLNSPNGLEVSVVKELTVVLFKFSDGFDSLMTGMLSRFHSIIESLFCIKTKVFIEK